MTDSNLFSFRAGTKRWALRLGLLVAAACAIWVVTRFFDARALLREFLEYLQGLGPWAPVLFILAYVVACLTFFPGVILTLGGGILFGLVKGTFLVALGATMGAACAFLVSRHLARGWVVRRFGSIPQFAAIDQATEKEGWKIVGLIRLSPVFPFVPMNFVFGLTKVPFWHFVGATFAGLFPMTMVFVYLGVLAGDIAKLGSQPLAQGKTKWIVTGIGLFTTALVTFLVTRIATRAVGKHVSNAKAARQ